jgi:hypothetical protein
MFMDDTIYGGLTTRTRFLNKVHEGQNIRRAYSKGKIPQQSTRRTEYIEGLQKWFLNKVHGGQHIRRAYI